MVVRAGTATTPATDVTTIVPIASDVTTIVPISSVSPTAIVIIVVISLTLIAVIVAFVVIKLLKYSALGWVFGLVLMLQLMLTLVLDLDLGFVSSFNFGLRCLWLSSWRICSNFHISVSVCHVCVCNPRICHGEQNPYTRNSSSHRNKKKEESDGDASGQRKDQTSTVLLTSMDSIEMAGAEDLSTPWWQLKWIVFRQFYGGGETRSFRMMCFRYSHNRFYFSSTSNLINYPIGVSIYSSTVVATNLYIPIQYYCEFQIPWYMISKYILGVEMM